MPEIYKIDHPETILEQYPQYGSLLDAYYFDYNTIEAEYVINSRSANFYHTRMVHAKQEVRPYLHLPRMKKIKDFVYGKRKIGMYVLPAEQETIIGANTEHFFTHRNVNSSLKKTLENAKDAKLVSTETFSDEYSEYTVKFYKGTASYMEITSNQAAGQFDFLKLMELKNKLFPNGAEKWLVAPIESDGTYNTIRFYEWSGQIPDLNKIVDYSKVPEKSKPLGDVIKVSQLIPERSRR